MKTLCYSVRLKSIYSISNKAYKVESFDGSSDILPKSAVFGEDADVIKSNAYWIAAWILDKKNIQYSGKKKAWFDENYDNGMLYQRSGRIITTYVPEHKGAISDNTIEELKK